MAEKVKRARNRIESYDVGRNITKVTSLMRDSLAAILADSILRQDFEVAAAACEQFLLTQDWNGTDVSKRYNENLSAALRAGAELLLRSSPSLQQIKRFWQKLHSTQSGEDAELTLVELAFLMVLYGELQQTANILAAIRSSDKGGGSAAVSLSRAALSALVAYYQWLMMIQGLESDDSSGLPHERLLNPVKFRGGTQHQRSRRLMQEYEGEAQRHFKEALRLDPGCTPLFLYSCQLLLASGRRADAADLMRRAQQTCPRDADIHAIRALLLELPGAPATPPYDELQQYQSVLAADPFSEAAIEGVIHVAAHHPDLVVPAMKSALSTLDVHIAGGYHPACRRLLAFLADGMMRVARAAYHAANRHVLSHPTQMGESGVEGEPAREGEKEAEEREGKGEEEAGDGEGEEKAGEGEDEKADAQDDVAHVRNGTRTLMPARRGLDDCQPWQEYQEVVSELKAREHWWVGCLCLWSTAAACPAEPSDDITPGPQEHTHAGVNGQENMSRQNDDALNARPAGEEENVGLSMAGQASRRKKFKVGVKRKRVGDGVVDGHHGAHTPAAVHNGVETDAVMFAHLLVVARFMFDEGHAVHDELKRAAGLTAERSRRWAILRGVADDLRDVVAEAARLSSRLQKYAVQVWRAQELDDEGLCCTKRHGRFRQLPASWWRVFPEWRRSKDKGARGRLPQTMRKPTRKGDVKDSGHLSGSGTRLEEGRIQSRRQASTRSGFQVVQRENRVIGSRQDGEDFGGARDVKNAGGREADQRLYGDDPRTSEAQESGWSDPTSVGVDDRDEEEDISMDSQLTYGDGDMNDGYESDEGQDIGSGYGFGTFGNWNTDGEDDNARDGRVDTDGSSRWADVEGSSQQSD